MYETPEELAELQELIDRSFATAGSHLTSIIEPQRRLTAEEIAAYLVGVKHLALATVTAKGEPRVGAVDGLFLHGHFWFTTSGDAVRVRHLEARPVVSATHVVGDDISITVHGTAHVVVGGTDEARALRPMWEAVYDGGAPEDWTPSPELGRYIRIDAERMYTYCFDRSKLPELIAAAQG